ncbi:MAG: hypothetical protein ACXIVQ_04335 [Acidimicrobiales bacterium]
MRWFVWVLMATGVAKALDAATLFTPRTAALMWLAAALVPLMHERVGLAAMSVVAFVSVDVAMPSMGSHVVLIGSVAAVLAVFDDAPTRLFLIRTQTVALYLFAGVNKLHPDFLRGDVIAQRQEWLPFPQALALVAVAAELWLAVAVLRRWRSAMPVALVLHVGIVVGMTRDFNQGLELVIFNGLTVAMVILVVTAHHAEHRRDFQLR